jgi:hypothetical protein
MSTPKSNPTVAQKTEIGGRSDMLQSLPLKGIAQGLRAGAAKFPFRSDAPSLAPDVVPAEGEVEPESAAALEARVLEILRVASKVPPGALRRDALAEVSRLRRRAIELHRRTAEDLKAQRAVIRSEEATR